MSDELYKAPAFQFYVDDFLGDTTDLTAEEIGIYMLLLSFQWKNGPIPGDAARQAQIGRVSVAKMRAIWKTLQRFYPREGDLLQGRLEEVRAEARAYHEQKTRAGRASAAKRRSIPVGNESATAFDFRYQREGERKPNPPVSVLRSPDSVTPSGVGELPTPRDFGDLEADVATHLALAAAENKSGRLSEGRAIGKRAALGAVLDECCDREAFAAGLRESNAKGVPNANYVRQCVRSAMERSGVHAIPKRRPPQNDASVIYGRFDPEPEA